MKPFESTDLSDIDFSSRLFDPFVTIASSLRDVSFCNLAARTLPSLKEKRLHSHRAIRQLVEHHLDIFVRIKDSLDDGRKDDALGALSDVTPFSGWPQTPSLAASSRKMEEAQRRSAPRRPSVFLGGGALDAVEQRYEHTERGVSRMLSELCGTVGQVVKTQGLLDSCATLLDVLRSPEAVYEICGYAVLLPLGAGKKPEEAAPTPENGEGDDGSTLSENSEFLAASLNSMSLNTREETAATRQLLARCVTFHEIALCPISALEELGDALPPSWVASRGVHRESQTAVTSGGRGGTESGFGAAHTTSIAPAAISGTAATSKGGATKEPVRDRDFHSALQAIRRSVLFLSDNYSFETGEPLAGQAAQMPADDAPGNNHAGAPAVFSNASTRQFSPTAEGEKTKESTRERAAPKRRNATLWGTEIRDDDRRVAVTFSFRISMALLSSALFLQETVYDSLRVLSVSETVVIESWLVLMVDLAALTGKLYLFCVKQQSILLSYAGVSAKALAQLKGFIGGGTAVDDDIASVHSCGSSVLRKTFSGSFGTEQRNGAPTRPIHPVEAYISVMESQYVDRVRRLADGAVTYAKRLEQHRGGAGRGEHGAATLDWNNGEDDVIQEPPFHMAIQSLGLENDLDAITEKEEMTTIFRSRTEIPIDPSNDGVDVELGLATGGGEIAGADESLHFLERLVRSSDLGEDLKGLPDISCTVAGIDLSAVFSASPAVYSKWRHRTLTALRQGRELGSGDAPKTPALTLSQKLLQQLGLTVSNDWVGVATAVLRGAFSQPPLSQQEEIRDALSSAMTRCPEALCRISKIDANDATWAELRKRCLRQVERDEARIVPVPRFFTDVSGGSSPSLSQRHLGSPLLTKSDALTEHTLNAVCRIIRTMTDVLGVVFRCQLHSDLVHVLWGSEGLPQLVSRCANLGATEGSSCGASLAQCAEAVQAAEIELALLVEAMADCWGHVVHSTSELTLRLKQTVSAALEEARPSSWHQKLLETLEQLRSVLVKKYIYGIELLGKAYFASFPLFHRLLWDVPQSASGDETPRRNSESENAEIGVRSVSVMSKRLFPTLSAAHPSTATPAKALNFIHLAVDRCARYLHRFEEVHGGYEIFVSHRPAVGSALAEPNSNVIVSVKHCAQLAKDAAVEEASRVERLVAQLLEATCDASLELCLDAQGPTPLLTASSTLAHCVDGMADILTLQKVLTASVVRDVLGNVVWPALAALELEPTASPSESRAAVQARERRFLGTPIGNVERLIQIALREAIRRFSSVLERDIALVVQFDGVAKPCFSWSAVAQHQRVRKRVTDALTHITRAHEQLQRLALPTISAPIVLRLMTFLVNTMAGALRPSTTSFDLYARSENFYIHGLSLLEAEGTFVSQVAGRLHRSASAQLRRRKFELSRSEAPPIHQSTLAPEIEVEAKLLSQSIGRLDGVTASLGKAANVTCGTMIQRAQRGLFLAEEMSLLITASERQTRVSAMVQEALEECRYLIDALTTDVDAGELLDRFAKEVNSREALATSPSTIAHNHKATAVYADPLEVRFPTASASASQMKSSVIQHSELLFSTGNPTEGTRVGADGSKRTRISFTDVPDAPTNFCQSLSAMSEGRTSESEWESARNRRDATKKKFTRPTAFRGQRGGRANR